MTDWAYTLEHSSLADLGWSADRIAPQAARKALYRILRQRAGRSRSPEPEPLMSSTDVMREAGITYRQLDYWTRQRCLVPERFRGGSGYERQWAPATVGVARLLGRLTATGLPLETAARIARSGASRHEIAPGIWLELGPPLSDPCDQGDCERCPDGPGDCGCGHHADELEVMP